MQPVKREQNNRIFVGGLTGSLSTASKSQVASFFESFGEIIHIDLPRDQQDKNRGHAIIEFTTHKEAKDASRLMNGVEVAPG